MQNKEKKREGKTITFYSYKGGVGRSMALVNIACLMAKQKKKVLLIDWDLEAPGLHSFFNNIKSEQLGLVDLITDLIVDLKKAIKEDNNTEERYEEFLSKNLDKFIIKDLKIEESNLQIDIIKAGKFDNDYSNKLKKIDWISFYKEAPAFFRTFAQFLEKDYDYILIDARTGLADTSGVCTMLMPQILVLVFTLNNQNINGIIDVAKQSGEYRFDSNDYRSLTILPLPSRIDSENTNRLQEWIETYKTKFEVLFKELYLLDECKLANYFNIAKIPYKPIYAYGENIPVLKEKTDNDFFISYHYLQFLKVLEDMTPIWDILSPEQLETNIKRANEHFQKGIEFYGKEEYEKSCSEFEKAVELKLEMAYNNWGLAIYKLAKMKEDEELFKKSIEKFNKAIELNPNNDFAYGNLGNAIYELAEMKEDEKLFNESIEKYKKVVELNPNDNIAYNNWGIVISELAKMNKNEELFKESFEKYKKAVKLNPKYYATYNNWGSVIAELANMNKDEELYRESFEKYKKAVELNPKYDVAYNNWGSAISELAKMKGNEELYRESIEKYKKAVELNPKFDFAYNNWGNAISELAKMKGNEELYRESIEKYKKAVELNPKFDLAYNNWGSAISELAKMKEDEKLFNESFEKYKKAIELNPKFDLAYNNWGLAIYKLAVMKEDEELFKESIEILKKGVDMGVDTYNLACAYSLIGDAGNALKYLEISLDKFNKDIKVIEADEYFKGLKEADGFMKLIAKYRK